MAYLQREPYRNEFISSLYTILHNSSNSSIVYTAHGILGHLGGKSRSTLKGVISLPCVEPSSGFRVVADAGEPFVLDGVLELAVQLLYRNRITESLDNTETKLATSLRTQICNIQMLRGVRTHYKQIAIHLISQCLILMFQTPTVLLDSLAAARAGGRALAPRQFPSCQGHRTRVVSPVPGTTLQLRRRRGVRSCSNKHTSHHRLAGLSTVAADPSAQRHNSGLRVQRLAICSGDSSAFAYAPLPGCFGPTGVQRREGAHGCADRLRRVVDRPSLAQRRARCRDHTDSSRVGESSCVSSPRTSLRDLAASGLTCEVVSLLARHLPPPSFLADEASRCRRRARLQHDSPHALRCPSRHSCGIRP